MNQSPRLVFLLTLRIPVGYFCAAEMFGPCTLALPQLLVGMANGPMRAYTSFGTS